MTITKGTQPKDLVATMVSLVKLFCDGGYSMVHFIWHVMTERLFSLPLTKVHDENISYICKQEFLSCSYAPTM